MFGQIGGTLFEEGITARQVSDALQGVPPSGEVSVRLSSPGGAVFEGMAIRSILAAHKGKVTVNIEGLAASAGSVIAMAGHTIRMHEGSSLMLHEGRATTQGDVASHNRAIQALETINEGAAAIYAARSGLSKVEIRKMMAAETWLTPDQAQKLGLVDEIVPARARTSASGVAMTMQYDLTPYDYQHVPPQFAAMMHDNRELDMSLEKIAEALGLDGEQDEDVLLAAIAELQSMAVSGEELRSQVSMVTGVGGSDGEVAGMLRGLKMAADEHARMASELAQRESELEEQAVMTLIESDKHDPKGRRLTPAMEAWAKEQGAGALRAFLAVAPHRIRMSVDDDGAQPGPSEGGVNYEGKRWEDMRPAEKHALAVADRETFDAMRADYHSRNG